MRSTLILAAFLTVTIFCKAQNLDRIYSFMNDELPVQEFGKSSWGIFLLGKPVIPDSEYCNKLMQRELKNVPKNIQSQLYKNCMALINNWPNKFLWEQSKMKHDIVVADTKHNLPLSIISTLKWSTPEIQKAKFWIKEWDKSKIDDRLINYSGIPVFSDDEQYVLILRGQDVKSEGGWETIYIYKKENGKWVIAERLIVSEI